MKYFTFAIALTAYAANAIAIQAEEPDIEIHIAGLDEMENYHGEELVEINIGDIDSDDHPDIHMDSEDVDNVDINYESSSEEVEYEPVPVDEEPDYEPVEIDDGDYDYEPVEILDEETDYDYEPVEVLENDEDVDAEDSYSNDDEIEHLDGVQQEDHTEAVYMNPEIIADYHESDPELEAEPEVPEEPKDNSCWLKSYGRGWGKPISACPSSKEKSGLLCYPKCRDGYKGVGPVCWERCPKSFRDDGAFCAKPKAYGRGVGSFWKSSKNNDKWGLLYYPKCRSGYHNVGCCICSPNCPSTMTDIGVSCAKRSYGRTAGTPLTCADGLELSGALCYPKCRDGAWGLGPMCWGKCPSGTKQCGVLCLSPERTCADTIKTMTVDTLTTAYNTK